MDKLVLFLLVSLIIITVLLLVNEFKKEQFEDLDLNENDKLLTIFDVFNFLGNVGLPIELQLSYASTILAEDKTRQPEIDNFFKLIKNGTLNIDSDVLDYIENIKDIKVKYVGLPNSLNYLLANVHAMKLFDAYNEFNYRKLYHMRKK